MIRAVLLVGWICWWCAPITPASGIQLLQSDDLHKWIFELEAYDSIYSVRSGPMEARSLLHSLSSHYRTTNWRLCLDSLGSIR